MQPYFFPYLGYFQLIMAADKFVIYDDVNFIKQGWINRNYILLNGSKHLFTIPVQNISSNVNINQTIISNKPFNWESKLLQTMTQAYKKAPYFYEVFSILETVIRGSTGKTINIVAVNSIVAVMEYLSVKKEIVQSSTIYNNDHLKSHNRVIDICIKENASHYFNASGGVDLYNKEKFLYNNLQLQFIKPRQKIYQQLNNEFVPGLSIIDTMMFNPIEIVVNMLNEYEFI